MKYIFSIQTDGDNLGMKHIKGSRLCKVVPRNIQILDRQYDLRRNLAFIARICKSLKTFLLPIWRWWWKLLRMDLRGRAQICSYEKKYSRVTPRRWKGQYYSNSENKWRQQRIRDIPPVWRGNVQWQGLCDIQSDINKDDKTSRVTLSEKSASECWIIQKWRHK